MDSFGIVASNCEINILIFIISLSLYDNLKSRKAI